MLKPAVDRGAVSVEYALLAIFIAIAAVVGLVVFGGFVDNLFQLGANKVPVP